MFGDPVVVFLEQDSSLGPAILKEVGGGKQLALLLPDGDQLCRVAGQELFQFLVDPYQSLQSFSGLLSLICVDDASGPVLFQEGRQTLPGCELRGLEFRGPGEGRQGLVSMSEFLEADRTQDPSQIVALFMLEDDLRNQRSFLLIFIQALARFVGRWRRNTLHSSRAASNSLFFTASLASFSVFFASYSMARPSSAGFLFTIFVVARVGFESYGRRTSAVYRGRSNAICGT